MRKRVSIGFTVVVAALVAAVLWHSLNRPDPVYRGKPLSLWLKEVPNPEAFNKGFNDLIQERGAAVLPHLIQALETRDNLLWQPYVWVRARGPAFVASRMREWVEPALVRKGAANWLGAMGPPAKPARETLRRAAAEDRNEAIREAAVHALVRIDVEEKETEVLLTALKDPSADVRRAAAGGLEIWTPDAPGVIPSLINGLSDTNAVVREVCAATLGEYGSKARRAAPPLRKLAASDDPAADYATQALKQIEPVETKELP